MWSQSTLLSGLLGLAATASIAVANSHGNNPRPASPSQCSPVVFTVNATAQNAIFSNSPDPNNSTAVLSFLTSTLNGIDFVIGTAPFSGTFTINGVYCKPTLPLEKHRNVLQFLVHGSTYNATMWSGYHFGTRYSWHHAANAQGYHTLAVDRLANGLNSRHLDPVTEVQAAIQVEIQAQLLQSVISNSRNNALDRSFTNIVYVGHSYGSTLGVALARQHPATVSAVVLTGFSSSVDYGLLASFPFAPAKEVHPSRFPAASVPAGYLTFNSASKRESLFYYGAYDRAIPPHDFAHEDIATPGEFGGLGGLSQPVSGFTKPVMIMTGVEDSICCVKPGTDPKECDKILEKTRLDFFPDLPESKFAYFAPRNTGHDLTLHYTGTEAFRQVHKFLNKYF